MHGLRIVPGEVLARSSAPVGKTVYEQTVAALGKDPEKLFRSGPASSGNCGCGWEGHQVFNFKGVGGDDIVRSGCSPRTS